MSQVNSFALWIGFLFHIRLIILRNRENKGINDQETTANSVIMHFATYLLR